MIRFDNTEETEKHIARVEELISDCMDELEARCLYHDYDKLHNKKEKELFDLYAPKLAKCTYGSEEYKSFLKDLEPALAIHYLENRHHPEHFENGIQGMDLIDLLEMICDWKASTERHEDGDIRKSLEINQKRFGYSDELKAILLNTVDFLEAGPDI